MDTKFIFFSEKLDLFSGKLNQLTWSTCSVCSAKDIWIKKSVRSTLKSNLATTYTRLLSMPLSRINYHHSYSVLVFCMYPFQIWIKIYIFLLFSKKKNEFNFPIVDFKYLSVVFPASPAYVVYVSQLFRYSRDCSRCQDFRKGALVLSHLFLH